MKRKKREWAYWIVNCDYCAGVTLVGVDALTEDMPEHCPLCGSGRVDVTEEDA